VFILRVQRRIAYRLSLVLILCGSAGCLSGIQPRECREFFQLSSSERESRFRQYPLDKQVDLYLCGMNREPPESGYAAYIAEGGEQVIPYLLQRIKTEPLEITKARILDIFTVLAVKGNLRGRQDVIDELDQVVSNIKFGPVKSMAERYMDTIKKETSRDFRVSDHE